MTLDPAALLAERTAAARAQEQALRAAIEATQDARSLTFTDDEHDPEGSTASLDQARDTALLVQVTRTLAELEAAQARLAAGTYGLCERCGRPIAEERLAARPEARFCITCAARPGRP
ncbi:TraR/DksA family transcriptional regulator [Microlunatus antarcticus]|uniref:TraR/DksA family transcriptional regulator n=1 Tax=Microlunatus antarcticus TaxID=53388 RepID=UPI00161DE336